MKKKKYINPSIETTLVCEDKEGNVHTFVELKHGTFKIVVPEGYAAKELRIKRLKQVG